MTVLALHSPLMELTLTRFVQALRSAELPVSPAETLDGFEIMQQVGIADPRLLEHALSLALAKTRDEKEQFARSFEHFFHQLAFTAPAKRSLLKNTNGAALLAKVAAENEAAAELVAPILNGARDLLSLRVEEQAARLGALDMRSLRDKTAAIEDLQRALGVSELDTVISAAPRELQSELPALRYLKRYVQEQIRTYVDTQYTLRVDATGKRTLLESALKSNLAALPPEYFSEVDRVVAKLADRLSRAHRVRRKRSQRGTLDLKHTLRSNIAYDGALFDLRWRKQKKQRAAVFVVCDVSNSVAALSRFLLLFLHGLTDALPELRAFAFSNRLGEITDTLKQHDVEAAVEGALFDWGKGTTDYGRALVDFRAATQQALDHRATVIFLGDARGNYFDGRTDILKEISARVKQVFWLNPESRDRWGEGDSNMRSYAAHCLRVDVCRDLKDIERFADRLLTATR